MVFRTNFHSFPRPFAAIVNGRRLATNGCQIWARVEMGSPIIWRLSTGAGSNGSGSPAKCARPGMVAATEGRTWKARASMEYLSNILAMLESFGKEALRPGLRGSDVTANSSEAPTSPTYSESVMVMEPSGLLRCVRLRRRDGNKPRANGASCARPGRFRLGPLCLGVLFFLPP